jgi:acyl transferase domain-containing protein
MSNEYDIAIIGMSCRFPGARNPQEFWRNLVGGVESIARLSDEELIAAGIPSDWLHRKDYVKASPVLDADPALFDASFFGYSDMEAATMDPQQRILLELAHTALEDAGCDPGRYRGQIGVFAGAAMNTYLMNNGLNSRFIEEYIPTLIVNDKDFLATRISYKLGLRGPSLTVQTACSTSLVAVHLARQSLLSGESDVALAGAVSVRVPHRAGYFYDGSGVVSPDGHVRAFDAKAAGTVFGSGAGVVVLKRLPDALADGDQIHAVIKGSAVNNDGNMKAGYTAPSVDGQADVVVEALSNAGVDAGSITYLEAHGSGTPVGDQIEIRALTKAFRNFTSRRSYCAIGSVKTNVGHLDVAAGMAGLIKTVLVLRHRQIPPTLHFSQANPEIEFGTTPFFVNPKTAEWVHEKGPRRAGVMATGMGGTNAHLVLEEAPAVTRNEASAAHLLVLSARTAPALDAACRNLSESLAASPPPLADAAWTLQAGRREFQHRRFLVCRSSEEAIEVLNSRDTGRAPCGSVDAEGRRPVVFLFPGVGDHYVGMAEGLYRRFDVFRQEVDRCAEILKPYLGLDIRGLLYPPDRAQQPTQERRIDFKKMLRASAEPADAAAQRLDETLYCQPALFTIQYALARLWQEWGITPELMVGHSMGEYVAACLAGVFSLQDALRLITARAKLVNALPRGAMTAVMLPERELLSLLDANLSVSLVNGPRLCVVAGPVESMARFHEKLEEHDILFRPVRNAHAFHTRMLDPIADAFRAELQSVRLSAPRLPFISNVTGTMIRAEQAIDPQYWVEHSRRTARFSDALQVMWQTPRCLPLEVGPGRTLGVLAMQHSARPGGANDRLVLSSLRQEYENQPDAEFILNSLGRLWLCGVPIEWEKVEPRSGRRKVSMPAYPFERTRHWIEPAAPNAGEEPTPDSKRKADLADWFYIPSWERLDFPFKSSASLKGSHWLILGHPTEPALRLKALLQREEALVTVAWLGSASNGSDSGAYEMIRTSDDYVQLLGSLKKDLNGLNIVHMGCVSPGTSQLHDFNQDFAFFSLLNLAKAIGEHDISYPIRLGVVTSQVHEVTGDEELNPAAATVLGPCGVIPKEYPGVTSFSVDLPSISRLEQTVDAWLARLLREFEDPVAGDLIAYRGKFRWKRIFKPVRLPTISVESHSQSLAAQGLRDRGVYLITGGTGGIGLTIARYLAETCRARLVLTKRSAFPAKSSWREALTSAVVPDSDRRIIEALLEIESLGAEVDVFVCEASDKTGMQHVVSAALAKHQAIHGVIHAAGILRDGLMQIKSAEWARSVLSPKVDGTLILFDLLKDVNPDFFVLFSSISSIAAFHGQGDYRAANSFLDAFSYFANSAGDVRALTINWPSWREVGILTRLQAKAGLESWKETRLRSAISTADGVEAFKRALTCPSPQIIVSPESLENVEATAVPQLEFVERVIATRTSDGAGRAPSADPPQTDVEKTVAEIWSAVVGIEPIGVHETFFDLGGHSLMAMQIVTRIRATYQINFTLRDFFDSPTIAAMSRAILLAMVSEVEGLSDDEVSRMMSDG